MAGLVELEFDPLTGREYAILHNWLSLSSARQDNRPVLMRGQTITDGDKRYSVASNGYALSMVGVALPALPGGMIPFKHSLPESFMVPYPDVLALYRSAIAQPKAASITLSRRDMLYILRAALVMTKQDALHGEACVRLKMQQDTGAGGSEALYVTNAAKHGISFTFRTKAQPSCSFEITMAIRALYDTLKYWATTSPHDDISMRFDVPMPSETPGPIIISDHRPKRLYTQTVLLMPVRAM